MQRFAEQRERRVNSASGRKRPSTSCATGVLSISVRPQLGLAPPTRRSNADRLWFPPALLECLVRVTAGFLFFLPQLEELAILPAPPIFRRPFAYDVFV